MVAIISDTLLETISECSHDSFSHCRGNSGDCPANSVFEGWKEMEEVDVAGAWFQQDGATAHTAQRSIQALQEMFPGKLISLAAMSGGQRIRLISLPAISSCGAI